MKFKNLLRWIFTAFVWKLLLCHVSAAVILVDDFEQGSYYTNDRNDISQAVELPFAYRRGVDINGCPSPGTNYYSSVDTNDGVARFVTNGGVLSPICPLTLRFFYSGEQMYDISGASGFILGIAQMTGAGTLSIEVGGEEEFTTLNKVSLTGPGEFFYPLSKVHENTGFSLEAFNILIFKIEASSPDFSITLDEIRLVPEPEAAVLSVAALAWGALGRKRRNATRSGK
jgi:hypothetical protein